MFLCKGIHWNQLWMWDHFNALLPPLASLTPTFVAPSSTCKRCHSGGSSFLGFSTKFFTESSQILSSNKRLKKSLRRKVLILFQIYYKNILHAYDPSIGFTIFCLSTNHQIQIFSETINLYSNDLSEWGNMHGRGGTTPLRMYRWIQGKILWRYDYIFVCYLYLYLTFNFQPLQAVS